jgi:hypothetical protein
MVKITKDSFELMNELADLVGLDISGKNLTKIAVECEIGQPPIVSVSEIVLAEESRDASS